MKKIQPKVNELFNEIITLLATHNLELKEQIEIILLEQERLKKDIIHLVRPILRVGTPSTSFIFNYEDTVEVATILPEYSSDEEGDVIFSEIHFRKELPGTVAELSLNAPFDTKLRDMLILLRRSLATEENFRAMHEETESMLLRTLDLQNIEHFVLHHEDVLYLVSIREERMRSEIVYSTIENISSPSVAKTPVLNETMNLIHIDFSSECGPHLKD